MAESPTQVLWSSVEAKIQGRERVGVLVSGGLDSAAVLYIVAEILQDPARVVALTAPMLDNKSQSSLTYARQIVDAVDPAIEMIACEATQQTVVWNSAGPRLDAAPALNDAIYISAQKSGCELVLTGNGADEIGAAPRFLFKGFVRGRKWQSIWPYTQDTVFYSAEAAILEPLAAFSSMLPPTLSSRLYSLACCPDERWPPPNILHNDLVDIVSSWTEAWLAKVRDLRTRWAAGDWAEIDALDSLYPFADDFVALPVLAYHPFRDRNVVAAMRSTPLADRYHARHRNPYWRLKGPIVDLFPERLLSVLPTEKQIYGNSIAMFHRRAGYKRLAEAGVLASCQLSQSSADNENKSLIVRLNAMETWLSEALSRGYQLVD